MHSFKNLIFDLGGVILDLNVERTLQAFADISGIEKSKVQEIFVTSGGFELYEKGMMNDPEFRNFVRKVYAVNVTDEDIDVCWNAMLLGIPEKKLELLRRLKQQYNVYLLSNTNPIHLHYINAKMLPAINGTPSLDSYFHMAYYSHLMHKRKPEPEIFLQVLEENQLLPGETLFLDDNYNNIEGAKAVGLQTVHVVKRDMILEYFND